MKIYRFIGLVVIAASIWGCSSTPTEKKQQVTVIQPEAKESTENTSSEISTVMAEFASTQNEQNLQQSLIALAAQYQAQNQCASSNTVIKHAMPLLSSVEPLAKANVIRSECIIIQIENQQGPLQLNTDTSAVSVPIPAAVSRLLANWLGDIDESTLDDSWSARLAFTQAYLHSMQGDYQTALNRLLNTSSASALSEALLPKLSFDWLSRLNVTQRKSMMDAHPNLLRYQALFSIIEDPSINDTQRQQRLLRLIENAQTKGEFNRLPEQLSLFLSLDVNKQQQTAVLLPLSGRLASQGEAIKQGMLAAYYQQMLSASNDMSEGLSTDEFPTNNLVFIDTGSENELTESINQESMQNYTTIIGPLLKSHIEATQAILPVGALRIYLNHLDGNSLNGLTSEPISQALVNFFALSPEQEAQALARQMFTQDIKHPILIHDDSAVTQRMADAFLETWKNQQTQHNTIAPSLVRYADNKSMRVGITSALDVLQSQQRINQLSNLVNETVFSVTRNRRDVDAFVVFARPNELELINPIIESSMSLFTGQQIPVYATSLSYNHKQNKNSLRDLRNLIFVDMPFVLPDGRDSQLAQEVDTLFNQPSSTYLRLFAFGYDAVLLTQQIVKLSVFNQISINGLTGSLSIDDNGNVERKLSTLAINTGT
ncbi:penicillin-binding protein activator [Glaciecola sp. SC05]|uniref:penicillin-binding protein activator n=1 Tax=Glaciecola sp. SC05 TaxID=1987355 RepID=UPI003527744F